jgi:hypothetical protein
MNVVHCCRGLFVCVVQQFLRLSSLNSYVRLLLIRVIPCLIVKPTLRHVAASPLAVYLDCQVVSLSLLRNSCSSSSCIKLTLALLNTRYDVAEVLRILSLVWLRGVDRLT